MFALIHKPSDFVIAHASSLDAFDASAFEHSVALALASEAPLYTIHTNKGVREAELPEVEPLLGRWRRPDISHHQLRFDHCPVPVGVLLDQLHDISPDLLVVGKRQSALLGDSSSESVSEALSRNIRNPTLVLPHGRRGLVNASNGAITLKRVLIPVEEEDAFHPAMEAIQHILNRISVDRPELVLLHVGRRPLPCFAQAKVPTVTREGVLEDVVREVAREYDVDLIAMSTNGHDSLLDMRHGSRTEHVLRSSEKPVLVVPYQ